MKRTKVDLLLHQYLTSQASPEETAKIEVWLSILRISPYLKLTVQDEEQLFQLISDHSYGRRDVITFGRRLKCNRILTKIRTIMLLLRIVVVRWIRKFHF